MKKINIILIIIIFIMLILIINKVNKQEIIENYKLESGISEENLRYELEREILYNEKSNYSEFNEQGERVNTSEEIKKEQILKDGLIVKDYKISYKDNLSQITAIIHNSTETEKGGYFANLVFYNDENKEISTLKVYLNKIKPGQETKIVTSVTLDVSDAYRCEIKELEEKKDE